MKQVILVLCIATVLAGCAIAPRDPDLGETRDAGVGGDMPVRPKARPTDLGARVAPPPATARTVEGFDTTTLEQRAAAQEVPVIAERRLGLTIASLGSPTEPGFWMKTPLVREETQGRVEYAVSGKSVQVTLIPIDGPESAGSRMSLPAFRLLEAPLTGLPEVAVFADN